MTIGTRLFTLFKGRLVGKDEQGNRYYEERGRPGARHRRRWVMYKGAVEASRVPPEWHAWLHRTVAAPPVEAKRPVRAWQKPHLPNRTGTTGAYRPPGHEYEGGKRARATGDYEPWRPN
jgi:NADH:ubiquinone oxidoreductase subunit